MSAQRKKIFLSVGLTLVAVLVSALVFWPKPTIESTARSVAYRAFSGDSNIILSLTPDSDLISTDVTKENWRKFVEVELTPRLKVMKITKDKLNMSANEKLLGVFYFVGSLDSMNRDLGVGVETTGEGVAVPMSIWVGMFSSAYSVVDLRIPDNEVAARAKDIQGASMKILEKYGIKRIVIGSQIRELSVNK